MKQQLDRNHPIPDTTVFDGRLSRRGYRLNKMRGAMPGWARRVHCHYYAPMTTGMGLPTFEAAQ